MLVVIHKIHTETRESVSSNEARREVFCKPLFHCNRQEVWVVCSQRAECYLVEWILKISEYTHLFAFILQLLN